MTTGLILGKMMPLHKGHEHLIYEGLNKCDVLHVVVCSLSSEPIDGELRYEWVKNAFKPYIERGKMVVHHLKEDWMPQEPSDCISEDVFFGCWAGVMESLCNTKFDYMFASEMYVHRVSKQLNCTPVLVDLYRSCYPVCGTWVREEPFMYWDFINPDVRKYFAKRILIIGGESTGKSTMTQMLDDHYHNKGYNCIDEQEFARGWIDRHLGGDMGKLEYDHITMFGKKQMERVNECVNLGFQIVFSDTDAIVSKIFQQAYYGKHSPELDEVIANEKWDLILFLENNVPWVDDGQRDLGEAEQREDFQHKLYVEIYKHEHLDNIAFINAEDYNERFEQAKKAVDNMLKLV